MLQSPKADNGNGRLIILGISKSRSGTTVTNLARARYSGAASRVAPIGKQEEEAGVSGRTNGKKEEFKNLATVLVLEEAANGGKRYCHSPTELPEYLSISKETCPLSSHWTGKEES